MMTKKRLYFWNIIYAMITLCIYWTAYISPAKFPLVGFFPAVIPIVWVSHVLLICLWLWLSYKRAWVSGLVILIGWQFFWVTVSWGAYIKDSSKQSFDVLSYNVRVFNSYKELQAEKPGSSELMIQWLESHPAEVKCFQEFYALPSSSLFNTLDKLGEAKGYKYQIAYEEALSFDHQYIGVAIFTKFPVLNSGDFPLNKHWTKRGVFMDVIISHDTLRIMNVHMQSIAMNEKSLYNWDSWSEFKSNYAGILKKLRNGYRKRGKQLKYLEKFIQQSPYDILLCGDFNDLPYSYTYTKLKQYFHNAFEDAGRGFGFTYNGKIPFLRIDNQFFSSRLRIVDFNTLYQYKYSDHFPILGRYEIK